MLLDWLSNRHNDPVLYQLGRLIEQAILSTIADGVRTQDLGGSASTTAFTQAVIRKLA